MAAFNQAAHWAVACGRRRYRGLQRRRGVWDSFRHRDGHVSWPDFKLGWSAARDGDGGQQHELRPCDHLGHRRSTRRIDAPQQWPDATRPHAQRRGGAAGEDHRERWPDRQWVIHYRQSGQLHVRVLDAGPRGCRHAGHDHSAVAMWSRSWRDPVILIALSEAAVYLGILGYFFWRVTRAVG